MCLFSLVDQNLTSLSSPQVASSNPSHEKLSALILELVVLGTQGGS